MLKIISDNFQCSIFEIICIEHFREPFDSSSESGMLRAAHHLLKALYLPIQFHCKTSETPAIKTATRAEDLLLYNYLSTAKIPNDLRITKNTFENLICCNIRNIKSNYLKFFRNIYHNLLCYYFFFNRTTFYQTPDVLVIIWLFSSRR